jgi:hypothetical protein
VESRASPPGWTGEKPVPPQASSRAILNPMRPMLRFLWNSTRGHRIAPWRSPYLLWRIETFTGVKMTQIGFLEFWEFLWIERGSLWRFLKWTAEMDRYVHPGAKNP